MNRLVQFALLLVPVLCGLSARAANAVDRPFRIEVVDEETGRGVPLVELKTTGGIRFFTDSQGVVAFDEPGLMNVAVFFHVQSHGYEFPKDEFGFRGKALDIKPGGNARLTIKRLNIARRLYRVTGAGIYRDSQLTGLEVPVKSPLLNSQVVGSDSVVNAVFQGKIHWFWGDTNRPGYPLGNFHVPGAISQLPVDGGLDPERGIDLTYVVDDHGFARPTARMPGDGPTWIEGLVVLTDADGRERMFCAYMKVKGMLDVYQRGMAEFDAASHSFHKVTEFDMASPALPGGHPFLLRDGDTEYVYFARPYPLVRVPARPESFSRPADYEAYTCLVEGSRLTKPLIDRGPDGQPRYAWKKNTPPVGPADQAKLIASKHLQPTEGLLQLRDHLSGSPVQAHSGSVYWNAFRRRWVMIALQSPGTSFLGEVWYAEADSPLGPWAYAVKIVTHNNYSFYNPKQHPMLDKDGGRQIFFEGTYANTFSGNPDQTPRYDYNQIMYQLDLADPPLAIPVAVYQRNTGLPDQFLLRSASTPAAMATAPTFGRIAFFAPGQPGTNQVAVYESQTAPGQPFLTTTIPAGKQIPHPLFYALPPDTAKPPTTTVPLYEYVDDNSGRRAYSIDPAARFAGLSRAAEPICHVWKNPWSTTQK